MKRYTPPTATVEKLPTEDLIRTSLQNQGVFNGANSGTSFSFNDFT